VTRTTPRPRWWHPIIRRLSASRWGSRLIASRLHTWDRFVLRITRGRTTATSALTGLPVILLLSTGARSGLERVTPLLAIGDEERYLLIATNFGSRRNPDWYYNLKANPEVEILKGRTRRRYVARELDGEERRQGWASAVEHFTGYAAYEARARRRIPILVLTPGSPGPA
jgi:deazaflavin-dependent oxidoreductase (nitroreductase family)